MITTIGLVSNYYLTELQFSFLGVRNVKNYSQQLLNIQNGIVNYSHHDVDYIPISNLYYNWEFVPLPPHPCLWHLLICSLFL